MKKKKQVFFQPAQTEEEKKKRIRNIIITAVVLVIAAVACYFAMPKNKDRRKIRIFPRAAYSIRQKLKRLQSRWWIILTRRISTD